MKKHIICICMAALLSLGLLTGCGAGKTDTDTAGTDGAAVCMACAALICKAAKKKLSKKVLAVIGAAAFVGAILAVILIARTPMPL